MYKILLVDDEQELCHLLRDFIQDNDSIEVECVHSAEAGWELISATEYDLIISDLNMPGMSGLDLLAKVKELPKCEQPDIFLMTGDPMISDDTLSKLNSSRLFFKPGLFQTMIDEVHFLAEQKEAA